MDISPKQAISIQKELASKVIKQDEFNNLNYIAGVDVSQQAFRQDLPFYAAVVVLSFPELEIIEQASHSENVSFPYIPGLLAFREAPIIIRALDKLKNKPDIIIVDGHGISHPRKLGIASHIGVLTNYATIGCAKSPMIGKPEKELPLEKGSVVPILWHNEIIGNLVRTKTKVNPVYVSIGHKVTLETATKVVLECTTKYKLPEPTRLAHQYANYVRRQQDINC